MNKIKFESVLASLPLGAYRYFDSIGSTNDEAFAWASKGAPDFALVVADEQTSGRGRMDHKWFTPPDSALALSLILRPMEAERAHPSQTTGLLALALTESLSRLGLSPQIKWPNDVLLNGKKVAGILVESSWIGETLEVLILGMGVNVHKASVPTAETILFPATSIETELGHSIERGDLLREILTRVLDWRPRLGTGALVKAWDEKLAFRGHQVLVEARDGETLIGEILGLASNGNLRLKDQHGKSVTVRFGEAHLRPLA